MKYHYTVAQDGSGDFRTLQEAVLHRSPQLRRWYWRLWHVFFPIRIDVHSGVYHGIAPVDLSITARFPTPRFEIHGNVFRSSL